MAKAKNKKRTKKAATPNTEIVVNRPILRVVIRFLVICILVASTLFYIDQKGVFDPDEKNNHTLKKWDAIYSLTQEHAIDILLIGNSHLYTGLNPKNLSVRLGVNAFVVASPGTHIADSYFSLKEALKLSKPKLVVVETYGINAFNPYKIKGQYLSDQFKSFSARKDVVEKLKSTPYLFVPNNYGYAWSNTLRNHDYLLSNQEQIEKNLDPRRALRKKNNNELYLGRYARFNTGINDSIIQLYDSLGASVDGNDYSWNAYTKKYLNKIVALCNEEEIEVIFYTIPMYHRHVENYDIWRDELNKLIAPTNKKWLDLQAKKYHSIFDREAFESTYGKNQHLTYKGSLKATYELAEYLEEQFPSLLPNRKEDEDWHELFYGEEGYFRQFLPKEGDKVNHVIKKKISLDGSRINADEITYFKFGKPYVLQIRVPKTAFSTKAEAQNHSILVNTTFKMDGKVNQANIKLNFDQYRTHESYYLFSSSLKPIEILEINAARLFKI